MAIGGATSATYNIASTTAGDAGGYDVIVTGACGALTSSAATLTVNPATVINTQPASQTITPGQSATFSVAAAGASLGYQWRKGGVAIGGATLASFTLPSAQAADAGSYDVVVTGACGTLTSQAATLTVNPPNTAPTINAVANTRQQGSPASNSTIATVGDADQAAGSLTVTVTSANPSNGVTLTKIVNTNGTITADIAAACNATAASFTLQASDGSATTPATLNVTVNANTAPTLGTYPDTLVAPGGNTTVTPSAAPADNGSIVSVTAAAAPGSFTGTLTTNAATGAVTINSANAPGAYTITVVATDDCGLTASRTFTLTVGTPNSAPTINALAVTRPQASPSANAQIATVNDVEDAAQSLLIQISSDGSAFGNAATSNGVTVTLTDQNAGATGSNPNALGQVFADIVAGCGATSASFTLRVTDNLGAMTTTTLTVTVTPEQQAPTLGLCPANQVGVTNLNAPTAPVAVTWPTLSVNDNCAGATSACTPPSGATFPLGTTTVTCTATDAAGNRSAACSFTVTMRQPRAAIKDLIAKVRALVSGTLTTAQANGLIGHLEMANTYLERGQTAQACTHLQNFSNAVNALTMPNGPLASAQAQSLLDYANKLRAASGCPNQARAETVALFNDASGAFQLNQQLTAEQADWVAQYSQAGDVPVAGDWDGDGTDTLGVFRHGVFHLRNNNQPGEERKGGELVIEFGLPGDVPVVGDWDGDGIDTIGVFRAGLFLLRNTNTAGAPDVTLYFGQAGDVPLAGDWDGDGQDSIGVYHAASGTFQLRNALADGAAEIVVQWGGANYLPVVGDWDGDGVTSIGLYGLGGELLLRNTNTAGPPEITLTLGLTGRLPVAGKWAGQP